MTSRDIHGGISISSSTTAAVDQVRRLEAKERKMPKGARWTILKALETSRTDRQEDALQELVESGFATGRGFRVKELLR